MKVKAYRNLKHGKKAPALYSLVALEGPQKGRVVDRVHRVLLTDCQFKVNEKGRQRVIREKRKSVHAYVIGVRSPGVAWGSLPSRVTYNPYLASSFLFNDQPVNGAGVVLLNEHGMTAAYLS